MLNSTGFNSLKFTCKAQITPRPLRERATFNASGRPRTLESRVRGETSVSFLKPLTLLSSFRSALLKLITGLSLKGRGYKMLLTNVIRVIEYFLDCNLVSFTALIQPNYLIFLNNMIFNGGF